MSAFCACGCHREAKIRGYSKRCYQRVNRAENAERLRHKVYTPWYGTDPASLGHGEPAPPVDSNLGGRRQSGKPSSGKPPPRFPVPCQELDLPPQRIGLFRA